MRKFRRVLDGLSAQGSGTAHRDRQTPRESVTAANFQLSNTVRHGFPYQPTTLAFDPVQKILAIGTRTGGVRILGRAGVDSYCQHQSEAAVLHLQFLINEGALVTACADDTLHLWNLRQKRPAVLHSLKFNRERITFCFLPFQSKWLYVGTERGNTHIVNIESFVLSGYVIMWNKAIELSTKTHPGPVVHLSESPRDESKLLIGFDSGTVVLWDLRAKKADFRIHYNEAIHSVSWHHEGKQFMCSHSDGSLTTWSLRNTTRPTQVTVPHGKLQHDGKKLEPCKPILKVEYKTLKSSEPFIIFSGGRSYDKVSSRPSLTIMHGKCTTALEMDYPIVEFLVLCETPYSNEVQEPYAVAVLLEKDFILVDLTQSTFPLFENPYPMDIHDSAVTCTAYFADCPQETVAALYWLAGKHRRQGYSHKEWPVNGGAWTLTSQAYPEIILTGHADGNIKFWDATAIGLRMLYKLRTSKVFEKLKLSDAVEEDPYAVQMLTWSPQSRHLCVVGVSSYAVLYGFSKQEVTAEVTVLDVCVQSEPSHIISPTETEHTHGSLASQSSQHPAGSPGTDGMPSLRVKTRSVRMPPGYQAQLVVQLMSSEGEAPQPITSVDMSSAYGLLALGSSTGVVVVDYIQKSVLLCMSTQDLHSYTDLYQRVSRSPRRSRQFTSDNFCMRGLYGFYSDSKKRIRTSYQSLTELSDNPPPSDLERTKSPTSAPYPNSLHPDSHVCEPVAALKTTHCSPVFYLLDNVKGPGRKLSLPTDLKTGLDHVNGHSISPTSQQAGPGRPRASGTEGPKSSRRGPGRPPFRKAQSAACMEITLPTSHTEAGYACRRAMLQHLHTVSMYSQDELHSGWSDRDVGEKSMSRSRSSSISSTEHEGREAVTRLCFMESYTRRSDAAVSPSLYVGTSTGAVHLLSLSVPAQDSPRLQEPVIVTPSGSVLMLKGSVLTLAWLDFSGALLSAPCQPYGDVSERHNKLSSPPSPPDSQCEEHLLLVCSQKQAKVFVMPPQTCVYAHSITDSSCVLRADVVSVCESVCLTCFCANGHILALSLPSLRPLLDVNYLPMTDMRIAHTFCFTNGGQALYLSSPTEIQRMCYTQDMCDNLQEMLGELFIPVETPEVQNRGFLKGFFGGNTQTFDREELFGEAAAGKASRSLAQHIPGQLGLECVKVCAGNVMGDLVKARVALDERGQRLGELEERTALLMSSADTFSKHTHELMVKSRDKKWYQL